jgi:hypothetical protein
LNILYLLYILDQNNIDLLNEYINLEDHDILKEKLIAFQESNSTIYPKTYPKTYPNTYIDVLNKINKKKEEELSQIKEKEAVLITNAKGKMRDIETIIMSGNYKKEDLMKRIKKIISIPNIPDFYVEHVANKYIDLKELERVNKPKRFYETKKKYTAETLYEKIRYLYYEVLEKFKDEQSKFIKEKQIVQRYGGKRKKRKSVKKKKNVKKRKNTKRKRI